MSGHPLAVSILLLQRLLLLQVLLLWVTTFEGGWLARKLSLFIDMVAISRGCALPAGNDHWRKFSPSHLDLHAARGLRVCRNKTRKYMEAQPCSTTRARSPPCVIQRCAGAARELALLSGQE